MTREQMYSLAESYAYDRWPDQTVQDDPELITEAGMSTITEWLTSAGITPATTRDVGAGDWVFDALRDDFEALAKAWDEGYEAGQEDALATEYSVTSAAGENPYRAASAKGDGK